MYQIFIDTNSSKDQSPEIIFMILKITYTCKLRIRVRSVILAYREKLELQISFYTRNLLPNRENLELLKMKRLLDSAGE